MNIPIEILGSKFFFNEKRDKIQKLYYYGEFFALLSFDDGWKETVYPLFQKYIKDVSNTLGNTGIDIQQEETQETVEVILSVSKHSKKNIENIFAITRDLQTDFEFSDVTQHVGKHFYDVKNALPVIKSPLDYDDPFFPRGQLQKHVAILQRQGLELEQLDHSIAKFSKINADKNHPLSQRLQDQKQLAEQMRNQVQILTNQVPEVTAEQYFLISQSPIESRGGTEVRAKKISQKKHSEEKAVKTATPQEAIPHTQPNDTILTEIRDLLKIIASQEPASLTIAKKETEVETNAKADIKAKEVPEKKNTPNSSRKKIPENTENAKYLQYINQTSLTLGDKEVIEKFTAEHIAPIQQAIANNTHQSAEGLLGILKSYIINSTIDIRGMSCDIELSPSDVSKEGKKMKVMYDVKIHTPLKFLLYHPFETGDLTNGLYQVEERKLNGKTSIQGNNCLHFIYKEACVSQKFLADSIHKSYSFPDIPQRDIPHLEWAFKRFLYKNTQKKGESRKVYKLRQARDFFQVYDSVYKLLDEIPKEIKNLYKSLKISSFQDMETYIDFLTGLHQLVQGKNWKSIVYGEKHQIQFPLKKELFWKFKIRNGELYRTKELSNGCQMDIGDVNEGIYFGESTEEKKRFIREHHKFSRKIHSVFYIKSHIIPKLGPNYEIEKVSSDRNRKDLFRFSPIPQKTKKKSTYYVSFGGNIVWDNSQKCFFPETQAIVLPTAPLTEETESEMKQIHADINEALSIYTKSIS